MKNWAILSGIEGNLAASPQATLVKPRQIVGVGNVGRIPGQATYTLYHPNSNRIEFKTVRYGSGRGFQNVNSSISQ
ncbi:MAG: hypothetical protein RLP02_26960 [Coleofasciculus sp. C2-GNP5-27]